MLRFALTAGAAGISLLATACAPAGLKSAPGERGLFAQLDDCGVDTRRGKLTLSKSEALVTMAAPQALGAKATRCMARALLDRGLDLQASDPGFGLRYAAAWQRESDGLGARMARAWIKRNKPGAKIAAYAPASETLDDYVRKLERLCGAPAGSVEVRPGAIRVPYLTGEADEQVSCVYLAALSADVKASGIRLESFTRETP